MSKETVIERVEQDIVQGEYGKARDRLNGLIHIYPNDVWLRGRLAEIWWKLHYPAMAGRYWYLEENRTDEVREAVEAFEKSCQRSPSEMWRLIKFRGDPDALPPFARQRILDLIAECKTRYGDYPVLKEGRTHWKRTAKRKIAEVSSLVGCLVVVLILIVLSIIGVVSLIGRMG